MFGTVQETPYDLRFSLLGVPIRVSVWFWVAGTVLGYGELKQGVEYLLAWLLVLFVSILVHEMGHALTARWFGHSPQVLLYHFGGLAYYQPFRNHTRAKSIAISFAGPGAGFILYGLTWLFVLFGIPLLPPLPEGMGRILSFILVQLLYINLWWGLINLLPVLPLDGGRISQEIFSGLNPRRGLWITAWTGAVIAGATAFWFYSQQETYVAVLFAMLCATNVSLIQQLRAGP